MSEDKLISPKVEKFPVQAVLKRVYCRVCDEELEYNGVPSGVGRYPHICVTTGCLWGVELNDIYPTIVYEEIE